MANLQLLILFFEARGVQLGDFLLFDEAEGLSKQAPILN